MQPWKPDINYGRRSYRNSWVAVTLLHDERCRWCLRWCSAGGRAHRSRGWRSCPPWDLCLCDLPNNIISCATLRPPRYNPPEGICHLSLMSADNTEAMSWSCGKPSVFVSTVLFISQISVALPVFVTLQCPREVAGRERWSWLHV